MWWTLVNDMNEMDYGLKEINEMEYGLKELKMKRWSMKLIMWQERSWDWVIMSRCIVNQNAISKQIGHDLEKFIKYKISKQTFFVYQPYLKITKCVYWF